MTQRITVLKGSPRENGNTNSLCSVFEERLLEHTALVRSFSLHQMKLNSCTACRACQKDWSRIYCVQNDDFAEISRAIADSDLIILAPPIYSWYCTPPMKALLDRMVYAFNIVLRRNPRSVVMGREIRRHSFHLRVSTRKRRRLIGRGHPKILQALQIKLSRHAL